jgi:hypothetical protein
MRTLDARLAGILASGRRPSITLFPGAEVLLPKRRVGRPRVRDERLPFKHYRDPRAGKYPARCLSRSCRKRLKANQRGVCSDACRDAIFNEAMLMLYLAGISKADLIAVYPELADVKILPHATPSPAAAVDSSQPVTGERIMSPSHRCAPPSERRLREARRAAAQIRNLASSDFAVRILR